MANKNRDEFTEKTKLQIAKRAGWFCSDPSCYCHEDNDAAIAFIHHAVLEGLLTPQEATDFVAGKMI